ncbi:uncharacterized protein ARMOST_02137 [Armillaria ostoyae]|uniref:Uncharacterized protein n=1 Tax=Armillaria ostoyae TaxID=47428 RepID=A0A284QQY2_ARMOS|nr:uncharacterized protein ARMOST_02137 [Armillaria ostoyae]
MGPGRSQPGLHPVFPPRLKFTTYLYLAPVHTPHTTTIIIAKTPARTLHASNADINGSQVHSSCRGSSNGGIVPDSSLKYLYNWRLPAS